MSVGSFLFGGKPNFKPDPTKAQFQNGDDFRFRNSNYLGLVDNRDPLQAQEGDVFRSAQQKLVGQLQGVASGQQRGAGEMAAQRAINQALAGQQALASQTRGANAGFAAREAARNAAGIQVAGAGQYQQAALQDQSQAQGLLGQLTSQGRQADQNLAIANMNAALQARGMDDQQRIALLSQLYGIDAAELQARMQQEQAQASAGRSKGLFGDLLQAGGMLGAAALAAPTGGASLAAVPAIAKAGG